MTKTTFSLEHIFPLHMREQLKREEWKENLEEIRIRVGQPVEFIYGDTWKYLGISTDKRYRITISDIVEMVNYISNYSLYAYRDELRQGYLTIEGGHRVGMSGVVAMENGKVVGLQPITFMNVRVARECIGCAEKISGYIRNDKKIFHTLIFSEPGMGKTTVLRDLVRVLSNGEHGKLGQKVSVVDERSELAACHVGVPQNDLGAHTDVLCGCSKAVGISMLIRSMSPQIVAVDELGGEDDFLAVEQAMYCGCKIIGTIHAGSITELCEKPRTSAWVKKGMFERYIKVGRQESGERVYEVYDAQMERVC